jgi:peptide/nickel transport system substrate-binding protein
LSRKVILVGLLVLAIALSSCNANQFRTNAARVPQLVTPSPSDPATFNAPLNESLYSVFGLIYEGLLTQNGEGDLEPALAESWQVSPDKKKIVFTMRPNLKWSDGAPLRVDDVVFSFNEIYLNEEVPTGTRDILQIGSTGKYPSVRKLDDRRVEFSVPEPFAPFLRYAGGIAILPAHALQESVRTTDANGNLKFLSTWGTDTDPRKVVVNGPYTLQRYMPSQRVIFTRNPHYWRKDAQGNPQPYIERIVQQIFGSEDAQLISFRSGELDDMGINPEAFQLVKQEEGRDNFTIYNAGPESGSRLVGFNLNKAKNAQGKPFVNPVHSKWFNTLTFRQAVAYAIDRERMVNNIYQGLGELQNSPLDSQNPFYLPPEKGVRVYDYNSEKSKQLLQNAGFKYNDRNELLDSEGNRVQFVLLVKAEEKARVSVATQIQQDLMRIGMKVDLQVLSFNSIVKKLQSRDWEAYVGGFGGGGVDPQSGFNIWSTQGSLHQFNQGPQPGEPPITGWEPSDWELEIDRLFTLGAQELDENKRKEIYGEFQKIAQEQLPFIYLVNPLQLQAIRNRIQGIKFSPLSGAYWNLYELQAKMN